MKTVFLMTAIFLNVSVTGCHLCQAETLPGEDIPRMKIQVKLDLPNQLLSGTALMEKQAIKNLELNVSGINVIRVENNGEKVPFYIRGHRLFLKGPASEPSAFIAIAFKKSLKKDSSSNDKEFLGGNFADRHFALLMSEWCPLFSVPAIYEIEAKVNTGMVAISEADKVTHTSEDRCDTYRFSFRHPRNSASLVVGRFHVIERQHGEVTIATYFLHKNRVLASRFLEKTGYFIDLFSKRISPYPFKRFCIVENPAPSGLGLPTFTLIGQQILRMPFVMDISLGHEILHSWFGNSVYVDYKGGNWCEGITSYLADHYFQSLKGRGAGYRHQILCDYKSYVNDNNSISLRKFRTKAGRASKAVGYGKGAMVFHMLRRLMGENKFFSAISEFSVKYRFETASWKEIEELFSRHAEMDLSSFFSQWLERDDIPVIRVKEASTEQDGEKDFRLLLKIEQKNGLPYSLQVPLTIFTPNGAVKKEISLAKRQETLSINLENRPVMAVLDRDYDIMRDLSATEFPPSLSRLFGAEKRFVIAPEDRKNGTYLPIISFLETRGFKLLQREKLRHSMFKTGSFVVLGATSGRLAQLGPELEFPGKGLAIAVRNNPFNPGQVTCAVMASSAEDCRKIMFKLPHYGKYSYLRFENGKLMEKHRANYERGIKIPITKAISGIKSSAIMTIPAIVNSLSSARVIYLGERHDQEGIHEAQLEMIKGLSDKGPVAVAMEMFQRPFQGIIDAYLNGKLQEKEFLKKTEYFKRWGFNYRFYRPVVEYCKTHHIPLVAINLPAELSKKIARSGIESLSSKEREALPHKLDFSNRLYRQELREIYEGHQADALQHFDYFFQAQIAWDETMARSIADFLDAHPEKKIIVIVGGGHVAFGYGIPSRVSGRRKDIRQAIVLFPEAEQIDSLEADYFLFVPKKKEPFVARLGVMLSGNNTLTVESVVPGSPAALGGITKGDIIEAMDEQKISDIYDLKLELFFKKKGQTARITILRTKKDGSTATKVLDTGPLIPFDWSRTQFHFGHVKK